MIAQEGDVKLTDFGIAKALDLMYNKEGDVIAGKDEYLSPEQARCEVTDHRADLFCCGIVMSELLLGYNIFEAYEPEDTRILELGCPNFTEIRPDIDPRLDKIFKPTERARDERYQSSEEMLTELEGFIYGDGYGPTNEKLAAYIYDVFGDDGENAALRWHQTGLPTTRFFIHNNQAMQSQGLRQVQKQTVNLYLHHNSAITKIGVPPLN